MHISGLCVAQRTPSTFPWAHSFFVSTFGLGWLPSVFRYRAFSPLPPFFVALVSVKGLGFPWFLVVFLAAMIRDSLTMDKTSTPARALWFWEDHKTTSPVELVKIWLVSLFVWPQQACWEFPFPVHNELTFSESKKKRIAMTTILYSTYELD